MIKPWLTLIAFASHGAKAGGLDDFSNNLATDLAPLLALFGENVTKQYLSESTDWLDYVIFALAPIGILTAIVSAIRVCGDPSLRAFIGRAQEGEGTIEAELCSSTSRDVCELFNNGGITRVLGAPKILEIVRIPEQPGSKDVGIRLFRDHLSNFLEFAEWKTTASSKPNAPPKGPLSGPNISLNVGIVKHPRPYYYIVAILGFILQAGVMAMAGAGSWILRWTNDEAFISERDAAISFILGTLFLCAGMFSCAALVGESTHEQYYHRPNTDNEQLFWLQPGRQVVGDQTFDAFAYFEDPKKRLSEYTTSTKITGRTSKPRVWGVIIVSLGGYIAQFIGLRGMNAYVAVAQLGITIVMSFLRGTLRMQRRTSEDNKLAEILDQVVGHELDWLAFEIAEDPGKEEIWHLAAHTGEIDIDPTVEKLFNYRVKLAQLTGHYCSRPTSRESYQEWKDGQVRVRTKSRELAKAICGAAEALIGLGEENGQVTLRIKVAMLDRQRQPSRQHSIELTLDPPGELFETWRMDSAKLEGILGLWLWSLKCAHYEEEEDGGENTDEHSKGHRTLSMRIISTFGVNGERGSILGNIDAWLGKNALGLSECTLSICGNGVCNSATRWTKSTECWHPLPRDRSKNCPSPWRLFFGWNTALISEGLSEGKTRVQFTHTQNTLLSHCSQELYTAMIMSMKNCLPDKIGNITPTEDAGQIRLHGAKISAAVDAFAESGLGSRSDALFCIIPALRTHLRCPEGQAIIPALISVAIKYWEKDNRRSETLLHWAKGYSKLSPIKSDECKAFIAIAEIYRWAFVSEHAEERRFGYTGIKWLLQSYQDNTRSGQENSTTKEILDRYRDIACQIAKDANEKTGFQGESISSGLVDGAELPNAIMADKRARTLYLLCRCPTANSVLGPALPLAAQKDWDEVVVALLELEAHPDSRDQSGTAALLYGARSGTTIIAETLLQYKASPNIQDTDNRTPLSWAAEKGHEGVVKLLADHTGVEVDLKDNEGRTPLSWATEKGHEGVVKLLADHTGVKMDLKDNKGQTPLSWAAQKGQKGIVNLLLADIRVDLNSKDNEGRTPLSWAAEKGQKGIVNLLLADIRVDLNSKDSRGRTPLLWAAEKRHESVVNLLLAEIRVDPNSKDNIGRTPLSWAAEKGHEDVVKLLADRSRIKVNSKDNEGRTPLSWAAEKGHEGVVKLLADHTGVELDLKDNEGRTPLSWAAEKGQKRVADLLVKDHRVDPNLKDSGGGTPLSWAAQNGNDDVVELLVYSNKVKPNLADNEERTPLAWAVFSGRDSVVKLLVKTTGVEVDLKDSEGRTPLSWAALIGNESIVNLLLADIRVDLNSKDSRGRTPLSWAVQNGNNGVVELLLQRDDITPDSKDNDERTPLWHAIVKGHENIATRLLQNSKVDANSKDIIEVMRIYGSNLLWQVAPKRRIR